MDINIIQGDLLKSDCDTIVNPANGHLSHGGGVARLIARAATDYPKGFVPPASPNANEALFDERDRYLAENRAWHQEQIDHPLIATGDAGWTSAGRLPYKGIVHAVGPIWGGGYFCERDLLEMAHDSAFRIAGEHGCKSVALPAISCGIFRFPIETAAPIAVQVAHWAEDYGVERVDFVLFEDAHYAAFQEAAGFYTTIEG